MRLGDNLVSEGIVHTRKYVGESLEKHTILTTIPDGLPQQIPHPDLISNGNGIGTRRYGCSVIPNTKTASAHARHCLNRMQPQLVSNVGVS